MLRIDRNVPVRITLERIPASGNQAEVVSAAIEAGAPNRRCTRRQPAAGQRATPCFVAHPTRRLIRLRIPAWQALLDLSPRTLPGDGLRPTCGSSELHPLLQATRSSPEDCGRFTDVNKRQSRGNQNRVEATAPRVRFGELCRRASVADPPTWASRLLRWFYRLFWDLYLACFGIYNLACIEEVFLDFEAPCFDRHHPVQRLEILVAL